MAEGNISMGGIGLIFKGLVLSFFILACGWIYTSFLSRQTVSVIGVGKEQATAQKATIVFAYTISSISQDDAIDRGEKGMTYVLGTLAPLNADNVKRVQYQIQPRYSAASATNEYTYVSGASVTISNPDNIASALKMLSAVNTKVTSVSYLPENETEVSERSKQSALNDALSNAQILAKAAGKHVGSIVAMEEQSSNAQTGSSITSVKADATATTPLVEIQSVVKVTYELTRW